MVSYIIYKICCDECDFIYVGSTQNFTRRKQQHKNNTGSNDVTKNRLKLYKTINEYKGWENWRMIRLEECDSSIQTKRQAEQKEEKWRVKLNATLNLQKAFRSNEEKKEYNKEKYKEWNKNNEDHSKIQRKNYREDNTDKIKHQKAEFYENNKEEIRQKQSIYREQNKTKINEQKKEYYQQNKDQLLEQVTSYRKHNKELISDKKKEKVKCSCGTIFRKEDNARHKRSITHTKWVVNNPDIPVCLEKINLHP
tara:strand:- start:7774 stop:8529 length:756 start_codon:yes stop_codon:yes gene_type:complete